MTNKTYDAIRRLVEIILPASSSAYFALAQIWNLPGADKVTGSIAVLTTFLGACVGLSNRKYYKSGRAYDGEIVTGTNPETGNSLYSLNVDMDLDEIPQRKAILFKVSPNGDLVPAEDSQPIQGL